MNYRAMSDEIDILLYVALGEEFNSVMTMLGDEFKSRELSDAALTGFFGTLASPALGRDFRIAVFPAGKMGNTRSANVASLLIEKLKPADIVVLGIAGSLSNDMEPGDVFIPDSVNEYLANSATRGEGENWTFDTSGNHFQTSARLLNRFQFFAHTQRVHYGRWQEDTQQRRAAIIPKSTEDALAAAGLKMRGACRLYAGDDRKLASGPAVGKGKAFVEWITREVDRKVAAMEMESAGVYDAGIIRTPAPRTVAIRGISDYADARKEKIETTARGLFRELSAKNALSLFITGIEAGLFGPEAAISIESAVSARVTVLESRVKSIFVIGGVTGETKDAEAELPRLHKASLRLGKILAHAGAQLLVCSPFPNSADYYTAMGYADGKADGVIQFHSPTHPKVEEKRRLLRETLGRPGLVIQDWNYPGPETDEADSWFQAWLLAQLQVLDKADAVVALGGKVSKTANTLLHLAEAKGLPIVSFSFLGGAAERACARRDWESLNPGFDASIMAKDDGIEQTIDIANRLLVDRVSRAFVSARRPRTVFVSFAHQDSAMAEVVASSLRSQGIEVLIGDDEIRVNQMIPASIEQAMLKSDVCAVLWSRNYALSPSCFDELNLATNQQSYGRMKLWLFNLDDSAIVPIQARKIPSISVRSPEAVQRVVSELLAHT
jgi:nucleoside phosphorylase